MIALSVEVDPSSLAEEIAESPDMTSGNYAKLLELIIDIEDRICDLQFTMALRDRLNSIIWEASE
jgi:hypothetical protein